jgi:hypothetical protein
VKQVLQVKQELLDSLGRREKRVLPELPEPQVLQDQEKLVLQEQREKRELPAPPERLAIQVPPGLQAAREPLEKLAAQVYLVLLARQVLREKPERQDLAGAMARGVAPARLDIREQLELQVRRAKPELQD